MSGGSGGGPRVRAGLVVSPGSLCFVCWHVGLFFPLLIKTNEQLDLQCSSWAVCVSQQRVAGAVVQERAPWGTPGLLTVLFLQRLWAGVSGPGSHHCHYCIDISVWTWSGKCHSHTGMNVSRMKFFMQQKVSPQSWCLV